MEDDKLAADEARRAEHHEVAKAGAEAEVEADIIERADRTTPSQERKVEAVSRDFRDKAVDDVIATDREVEQGRTAARISQVVDYIFYVIYALLGLRLLLALLAARRSAGFTQLIYGITEPLYAPFRGIVAEPAAEGGYRLALSVIIAIVVYALLHAAINGILRLLAHRKTHI